MLGPNAQTALKRAQHKAHQTKAPVVTEAHFLWALLQEGETLDTIRNSGVNNLDALKAKVDGLVDATANKATSADLPPIGESLAKFIRNETGDAVRQLRDPKISSDAMVLSLIDNGHPHTRQVLQEANLARDKFVQLAEARRGRGTAQNNLSPTLVRYGTDLTEQAKQGAFQHISGRENELERMRGPFIGSGPRIATLVSENGTGKTALIEEIALFTAMDDSNPNKPREWRKKRLVSINVSALSAGATAANQADGRLADLIAEAKATKGTAEEIILVLEDVKAPKQNKPYLDVAGEIVRNRRDLPGAFITAEYKPWKQFLETEAGLGALKSEIYVNPPDEREVKRILLAHRDRLQRDYGVIIDNNAIDEVQKLAAKYVGDSPDPERSLRLLQLTCERYRLTTESEPLQVQLLNKKIKDLETDIFTWESQPKNGLTQRKLALLNEELGTVTREKLAMEGKFSEAQKVRKEYDALSTYVRQLEEYLSFTRDENITIDRTHYEGLLARKKQELVPLLEKMTATETEFPSLSRTVNKMHIATVIQQDKGIPLQNMLANEKLRLAQLPEFLDQHLIGQPHAKQIVTQAIYRLKTQLQDPKRPLVLRFKAEDDGTGVGASGVGKTEMVKVLALFEFGTEDAIIREDMGNYSESHSVSKLIGSPPGYVGNDEGGQFANKVMRRPYAIALLDEANNAHDKVMATMLPWFDDGYMVDSLGRKIPLNHIIFVITDNFSDTPGTRTYSPQLRNRMVEVNFKVLKEAELLDVYKLQIEPVIQRVLEKLGITFEVDDAVKKKMAQEAFENMGAREMRRLIDHYIIGPIAENYIKDEYKEGNHVVFHIDEQTGKIAAKLGEPKHCGPAVAEMAN